MESFHCRQIDKSWVPGSQGHFGPRQLQPLQHYGIFVNILGKRFMDEYGPAVRSDTVSCTIIRQPEGAVAYLWDATVSAVMGKRLDNYRPEGVVFQANTLEEITKVIGCPLPELRKTVETFNKAASEGKTANLDVPKSDFIYPLKKPPFTGIFPVWSGHNATFGGPAINGNAEVLDVKDNPIPGLYAAGETAGGFFYGHYSTTPGGATSYQGNYQVTSSALGYCIVFGQIAGANAVRKLR
ncbi:MAG: FAD-binding protein, partial [Dehalococcoidia bacterium]|nr:FAD-binding protein [Dehalococcoidia bacterium]